MYSFILAGAMNMIPTIKAAGILVINDPHQSSVKPSTRTDECFFETVSAKIHQALVIAAKNNLIPVCTGDFFDRDKDNSLAMLVSTIRALNVDEYPNHHELWCIPGNHDTKRKHLEDSNPLKALLEAGLVKFLPNMEYGFILDTGESRIGVWSVHYGNKVPAESPQWGEMVRPENETSCFDDSICFTHHDFDFPSTGWEGHDRMSPILGCSNVFNGHIHSYYPSVQHGGTAYHNLGNITRVSKSQIDHIPKVWGFWPDTGKLSPFIIEHKAEIFAPDVSPLDGETGGQIMSPSEFIGLISSDSSFLSASTQDYSGLRTRIESLFSTTGLEPSTQQNILALFSKACNRIHGDS